MNKKKAEKIVQTVMHYYDVPAIKNTHIFESCVKSIMDIANTKCNHPFNKVKYSDEDGFQCLECDEYVKIGSYVSINK